VALVILSVAKDLEKLARDDIKCYRLMVLAFSAVAKATS
jgi:hypothetical protein